MINQDGLDEVMRNVVGVYVIVVGKCAVMEHVNILKREINPNSIYIYSFVCV